MTRGEPGPIRFSGELGRHQREKAKNAKAWAKQHTEDLKPVNEALAFIDEGKFSFVVKAFHSRANKMSASDRQENFMGMLRTMGNHVRAAQGSAEYITGNRTDIDARVKDFEKILKTLGLNELHMSTDAIAKATSPDSLKEFESALKAFFDTKKAKKK